MSHDQIVRVERSGYDSSDHSTPRLTTVAKVSYGSLRNKGKDSTCISFGSYSIESFG